MNEKMQVPFHDLRARELGDLSCLCPTLLFVKVYAVLQVVFFVFFFSNKKVQLGTIVHAFGIGRVEGH